MKVVCNGIQGIKPMREVKIFDAKGKLKKIIPKN